MAGMIQELENQHGAVMEQTQILFQERLNSMIQELQSKHTRDIKGIRNSHDTKMEDVLRGYTEMSHQFPELKNRYNDVSHQIAITIDEIDNLREALSRAAPSHQEASRVPCESSGFAPHPVGGLARVGTSSSSNVPGVAFQMDLILGHPPKAENHRMIQLRSMVLQAMMQFQRCRSELKISWTS